MSCPNCANAKVLQRAVIARALRAGARARLGIDPVLQLSSLRQQMLVLADQLEMKCTDCAVSAATTEIMGA